MFLALSLGIYFVMFIIWLLVRACKLDMEKRYFHIRFVAVTVIYAVAASVFFVNVLQVINKLLSIKKIQDFLFGIMPGSNASASFFWVVTLLACLLLSVGYLVLILVVRTVWVKPVAIKNDTARCNRLERLFNKVSEGFYENLGSSYALSPSAYNIGKWFRYMRIFFGLLITLEAIVVPLYLHFGLMPQFDEKISVLIKSLFMIPVVSFFTMDQTEIYLMGDEKYDSFLETEGNHLTQTGNYKIFVDLFENYFDDALINKHINEERQVAQRSLFSDIGSDQMERAGENAEMLCAIHRCAMNAISEDSPHYTEALIDLVNGKSVAVFDTIKGEFNLYYLAYLQSNLFLRRKALVICDTERQAKEIVAQYKTIFKRLNKVNSIWRISTVDTMDEMNTDILICTEEQLINDNILTNYREFFNHLHDVVVMDTYSILCRNSSFVFRFFHSLYQKHVQFMFFLSENNLDIKNALRSYINGADIELYENFRSNADTCILCWRAESYYKAQTAVSKNLNDYFGLAYTLALVAAKYDVPRVNIHAPESVPLDTYASVVARNEHIIAQSILQRQGVIMDGIVRHNPIVAFEPQPLSFEIVYDENNNLLNAAQMMVPDAGTVSSIINIISRPYMLRDYLAHKIELMNDNQSGLQQLVPSYFSDDIQSPCVALLIKLREKGMTCEEILEYMAQFGVTGMKVEKVLALALDTVMGVKGHYKVYECFSFGSREIAVFKDGKYCYTRMVTLTDESVYHEACRLTINYIRIDGEYSDILPLDKDVVYNRYLPGQIHSFGYKRYRINSITNGVLFVESEETIEREYEYTGCYRIDSADLQVQTEKAFTNKHFDCDLVQGTMQRTIHGYFTHINGLDFIEDNTHYMALNEPITESKNVHGVHITVKAPFGDNYQKSALLMKEMLNGVLQTLLPKNYRDLMVFTRAERDEFNDIDFYEQTEESGHLRPDPIPSDWEDEVMEYTTPSIYLLHYLIPEMDVSSLTANNAEQIHLYIVDYNSVNNGIVETISKNIERIFSVMRSYLDWYIANPKEKHGYLNFGCVNIPPIFDIVTVHSCLERVAKRIHEPEVSITDTLLIPRDTEVSFCDFCGRPLTATKRQYDDDRLICESCYQHISSEKEEVEIIREKAYETLQALYGIEVPRSDIKLRLKTAKSIRERIRVSMPGKRILGFYEPRHRELWVENGGPEACVLATLIHELTHAWQFDNLEPEALANLPYIEGHAVYVEIECLKKLGQVVYAEFTEANLIAGKDEVYCKGYLDWCKKMKGESDKNIFHKVLKEAGKKK